MTFLLRCLVLALASLGVAALVSSLMVALTWWRKAPGGSAADRADALLRLRLIPSAAATITCLFAIVGLWRFESRDTDEVLGWTLRGGAAVGALLLTVFVARLCRMRLETRRLLCTWLSRATPITWPGVSVPAFRIDTSFPVVAVVGIFRPTLVLDAMVLDGCSADELSAVLAHEEGHLRRRDNLRRALFAAVPDLLARTAAGSRLRDDWRLATEEAADDAAAERGEEARVHLASALVQVARLAPDATEEAAAAFHGLPLPAGTLYRGESVERRVRRLIEAPTPPQRHSRCRTGLAASMAVLALALAFQSDIHDLIELVVAVLP
jgi:hypothetical protein